MASITSTQVNSTPRGGGELYVTFQFTLNNGDVIFDCPRFYPLDADLNSAGDVVGQKLLDALAAHEIDEWLSL